MIPREHQKITFEAKIEKMVKVCIKILIVGSILIWRDIDHIFTYNFTRDNPFREGMLMIPTW